MPAPDQLAPNGTRGNENGHSGTTGGISYASSLTVVSNGSVNGDRPVQSLDGALNGAATPQSDLKDLNSQLQVEVLIKEGAEKLLQMSLTDDLRLQVESELATARYKINDITKRMENQATRNTRRRPELGSLRRKFAGTNIVPPTKPRETPEDREDFRSALSQATTHIGTLHALSRPSSLSPVNGASSSSSPLPTSDVDMNKARVETMTQLINILQRNLRVRYEVNAVDIAQAVIPALSDRASKQCRATVYRLIRHLLVDVKTVRAVQEQGIDWFIVKSLARDHKHAVEKEQVVKLLRAFIEIGSEKPSSQSSAYLGTVPLSEVVIRAVISVAEHSDDPFRPLCIQMLIEILLIDVELMARSGGIRCLLTVMVEGPSELSPLVTSAFLCIADSPSSRVYLTPGSDLEHALSGITDAYGKPPDFVDRMKTTAKSIVAMLRTWTGLLYFCLDDKLAIRAIVDHLRIPSLDTREVIIDMFFDLFNIKPPEWHQAFIEGKRLTMYRKTRQFTEDGKPKISDTSPVPADPETPQTRKLTDQYIALLILVFAKAGLIDALSGMLEETSIASSLSRKAILLLAEVLQTSNRVLPFSISPRVQALPRVFNLAANFDRDFGSRRIIGTSALSAIDSYNRHRARAHILNANTVSNNRPRANSNSVEDALKRSQKQLEQQKIKHGMQMDDKTFQITLLETQVMVTKDHTKWNFETLQDLIEGALMNPKRMEEAIKVSRYTKKLLSFYHPFSHRFSDLPRIPANAKWVKLGCTFMNALLSSPEGVRFLGEDEFLDQIVQSFAQMDPVNGNIGADHMFSKKRMDETCTYGYFEMLGALTKRREGVELLEKFKLFTAAYHLSELRSREDLIKGIIETIDYSTDGHARIVLSKALTSSYKHIRIDATNHLGELIRASPTANIWTLRLLLTQLYDPADEVRSVAVRILEEVCEEPDVLQLVVEMHPTLDHLGEVGHPLILKFMSTSVGFRYLYAAEYIDREMDTWFHERNLHYVIHMEVCLAKAFDSFRSDRRVDQSSSDGVVPPHFYGVLAKTDLGCQVLEDKGHFGEFAAFIRRHGLENEDPGMIKQLKSVLWAVGNIGASERGIPFLEAEELIPAILKIAEESQVISVRGTCFFVLGLISSTTQGAEILDDYRWEATLDPLGNPTGLCIPLEVDKFTSLPTWKPIIASSKLNRLKEPRTDEERDVMDSIYKLSNSVIANNAHRTLTRMKTRPEYRHIFTSPQMLYRAIHAMSLQRYRLPYRRFILDLFSSIDIDAEVLRSFAEYDKILKISDNEPPSRSPPTRRVVSMLPTGRNTKFSDSEESDLDVQEEPAVPKHPVMSMRPISRIAGGFD